VTVSKISAKAAAKLRAQFKDNGYVLIKGFYDSKKDVAPIQKDIMKIISAVCAQYGLPSKFKNPMEAMNRGYADLIAKDRRLGGVVYDAVKQTPSFLRLVSKAENQVLCHLLRANYFTGIAAGGYGIRIDNPSEEKFRAQWHQEFPAQLRSLDGIVFWSPLVHVTDAMGPVQIAVGSQKEGPLAVYRDDKGVNATGAYALHIHHLEEHLAKYKVIAPLTKPGDLILMDFQTLHQSGFNRTDRPRWSMQFRYFNFNEPVGQRINWVGAFAAGVDFAKVLPELAR
jgi:ectoine hydroxylase-related dioxygenase (phytanoyl-CoA dioxygenase family)